MIFHTQYTGRSAITNSLSRSHVQFATNTLREPTFFEGTLGQPLVFRDALAALYQVVVSDHKYRPRDRVEFKAWLEKQDQEFLASLGVQSAEAKRKLEELETRKAELESLQKKRLAPFYAARRKYFDYVYTDEYEQYLILDPVITVHPDEVSFEAFSKDESTYARLAAKYPLFDEVREFSCGTTNIDFSIRLHLELERMRSYRQTRFEINPSGFSVAQLANEGEEETIHREKKIELPESWLNGFLQVHAVMAMGLTHIQLASVDLFNICRALRRRKARISPRSLRYELEPGKRPWVVLEPWEEIIPLTGSEIYEGPKAVSIRTWGRDRLQVLARMIPICRKVDLYLAGYGLPSFYVMDLGAVTFTLGLSGWTDNDWTEGASFDLLTRQQDVTASELMTVYESLCETRYASDQELSTRTGLPREKCRSAASHLCGVGRGMVDLVGGVYRHRDLFSSPFTTQEANKAVSSQAEEQNPDAKAARQIFENGDARFTARRPVSTGYKLTGSVKGLDGNRVRPLLHVDFESRIVDATCTCPKFKHSKLTQGPCEHMLALRLLHMKLLED
ncbi:MAG: SWIM zinc finger family protein [Planctomycetaceae bacterium]|nr:SWIM zinc finger family protein [Planctomycetaceae bacterium]